MSNTRGIISTNKLFANEAITINISNINDNGYLIRNTNILTCTEPWIIVDVGGDGDYSSLSSAITDGKKKIFIKNGIYTESSIISLASGTHIRGETPWGVVFDFGNKSAGFNTMADFLYNAGTITFTNSSSVITGMGTTWDTSISTNYVICTPHGIFNIASIDSNTQITLTQIYQGNTISNISYFIVDPITLCLENFTIKGTNSGGISSTIGVVNSLMKNLIISDCQSTSGTGICLDYACSVKIDNCYISNTDNYSIILRDCFNVKVLDCSTKTSHLAGLSILNCENICIEKLTSCRNKTHGILILGKDVTVSGCNLSNNLAGGVNIISNSKSVNLEGCNINYNGGSGVNISSRTDRTVVSKCRVIGNTVIGISAIGETEIRGCIINQNKAIGIDINTTSGTSVTNCKIESNNEEGICINASLCIITNNHVINNGTAGNFDGILVTSGGDNSIVSGNRCISNTNYGIIIASGANKCILKSNRLLFNEAGTYLNDGTLTSLNDNI